MARTVPVTVVETPEFLAAVNRLMDEAERMLLVAPTIPWRATSSPEPAACAICVGPGGRGKRGGAVIYFHHGAGMPLFVLTAYAKNQRADLSQQDRNDFKRLTSVLVEAFKRRKT